MLPEASAETHSELWAPTKKLKGFLGGVGVTTLN